MRASQRGFTLTELLIVVALLAIVAQIALPAWQSFILNNRSQALRDSVTRAVLQARSLAAGHRVQVELCGSVDGRDCHANWAKGWIIRRHSRGTPQATPEYITTLNDQHLQLKWAGFQPRILFQSGGYGTTVNGRFYLCREQKIDWQLIINRQGRLRQASASENRDADYRCAG